MGQNSYSFKTITKSLSSCFSMLFSIRSSLVEIRCRLQLRLWLGESEIVGGSVVVIFPCKSIVFSIFKFIQR